MTLIDVLKNWLHTLKKINLKMFTLLLLMYNFQDYYISSRDNNATLNGYYLLQQNG